MNRTLAVGSGGLLLALAGCGAEGLLGESAITPTIREACAEVMTEGEMLAALTIAQIDRLNGYSMAEELQAATQGCTTDSVLGDQTYEQCLDCKAAILDQVYGL